MLRYLKPFGNQTTTLLRKKGLNPTYPFQALHVCLGFSILNASAKTVINIVPPRNCEIPLKSPFSIPLLADASRIGNYSIKTKVHLFLSSIAREVFTTLFFIAMLQQQQHIFNKKLETKDMFDLKE